MKQLIIKLLVALIIIFLILFRIQHSSILKSVQRQAEFEKDIKSGEPYLVEYSELLKSAIYRINIGDYQGARLILENLAEEKPDWSEVHYRLGFVYNKLGYRDKALGEYGILKGVDSNLAQKLLESIDKIDTVNLK